MASRKEEKERLRQIRLEAEQQDRASQRRRLLVGYGLAGIVGLAVLAGIVALIASSGGGSETSGGCSHVDPITATGGSGSVNDVPLDNRCDAPKPPKAKVTDLTQAAKDAGCVLRLGLKDEGHNHIA